MRVTSPIEQGSYMEAIARTLSIPQADIARELVLYAATQQSAPTAAVIDAFVQETITPEERFIALAAQYPTEAIVAQRGALSALSFGEHRFAFPLVTPERMIEITTLVEREYGVLSLEERDALAEELAQKLTERFFFFFRNELTMILQDAESRNDETLVHKTMHELQELNKRRHGAP